MRFTYGMMIVAAGALVALAGCRDLSGPTGSEVEVAGRVIMSEGDTAIANAVVQITLGQGVASTVIAADTTDTGGSFSVRYNRNQERDVFMVAKASGFRDSPFVKLNPSGNRLFVTFELDRSGPSGPQ